MYERRGLGPWSDQAVEVSRFELVGVAREATQVTDAVVRADPTCRTRPSWTRRRVSWKPPALHTSESRGVPDRAIALAAEESCRSDAVGHVEDSPLVLQAASVAAAVAAAAAVVDVDDRESAGGEELFSDVVQWRR